MGASTNFHALMSDNISDNHLTGDTDAFPRWTYQEETQMMRRPDDKSPPLTRVSNINPAALAEFRSVYDDQSITDDDLFHYAYAALHSRQWRETFANDLAKDHARIPMAASARDFWAFADAGRELANLHVNYESVEPYPLDEIYADGWNPDAPDAYRVQKMAYGGKARNPDKTRIAYNAGVTLADIPDKAHEYQLGSRSALDWLIDRYQVRTYNKSGIVNDPNDWAAEVGEPRYIVDLIKRVTTVSVRTVDIVNGLPEFPMR